MITTNKKVKIKYVCQHCAHDSLRWLGKCPSCEQWNSFVEEIDKTSNIQRYHAQDNNAPNQALNVNLIKETQETRIKTTYSELDRILGGGLVTGAFTLVGGDPGIGKSTLLLQVSDVLAVNGKKVLYVSGEESLSQIKGRAKRLNVKSENLFILSEVNLEIICENITKLQPDIVVIDSIQIVYKPDIPSSPGTVVQVRESAHELMLLAKQKNIAIFVVGHVTKDGNIAGPKVLEHLVDTVLYFEGDSNHSFRILRAVKNRFGPTNEIAIFEMKQDGLKQIDNPSELLLSEESEGISGVVIVPAVEGTRPLLIELQALLSDAHGFGIPRRVSTFLDNKRVSLLIAIFEKVLGIGLGNQDVFINLVGGIKISEPALDLGIIASMASSFRNIVIDKDTTIFGEVGLGGEVRGVGHFDKRVKESEKLGFKRCIVPEKNLKKIEKNDYNIKLIGVKRISDLEDNLF